MRDDLRLAAGDPRPCLVLLADGRWWWVTDSYVIWRQLEYRVYFVGIGNGIRPKHYGREPEEEREKRVQKKRK